MLRPKGEEMAAEIDPIIGQCRKCKKNIRESHQYVWCDACGEPISDDINIKRKRSTENVIEEDPKANSGQENQGPITALKVFAYINLIGGIVAAITIWASMGTTPVLGSSYRTEANPFGIVLGFVFLAEGTFGCALLLVIAGMAEDLIAIRRNTENMLASFRLSGCHSKQQDIV
jgi:hypothetical protein